MWIILNMHFLNISICAHFCTCGFHVWLLNSVWCVLMVFMSKFLGVSTLLTGGGFVKMVAMSLLYSAHRGACVDATGFCVALLCRFFYIKSLVGGGRYATLPYLLKRVLRTSRTSQVKKESVHVLQNQLIIFLFV